DNCSMYGKAALYKLSEFSSREIFWNDPDLFKGSVRGITSTSEGLWIAVGYQRALGRQLVRSGWSSGVEYKKRWGEDASTVHEASLIKLLGDGTAIIRKSLSAGLSIFVTGIEHNPGAESPIIYGTLGGMPALSRWTN